MTDDHQHVPGAGALPQGHVELNGKLVPKAQAIREQMRFSSGGSAPVEEVHHGVVSIRPASTITTTRARGHAPRPATNGRTRGTRRTSSRSSSRGGDSGDDPHEVRPSDSGRLPLHPAELADLTTPERGKVYRRAGLDALQIASAEDAVRALTAGKYGTAGVANG